MKRVVRRYWMVVAVVLGVMAAGSWWVVSRPVLGQADALPAGWQDLPLQSFIDQARQALAAQPPPAAELVTSIRRHAAERLKTLSQQSRASFDSLLDLYDWGRGELSAQERDAVLAQLKPTADDVASWDLARLHRADDRMRQLALTASSRESLLISWLERPLNETLLAGLEADHAVRASELSWLCLALDGLGPTADKFSVTWTGFIAAPVSGSYTFSTTPIDVNFEGPDGHVRQRLLVTIDGRTVLEAGGENWTVQAKAVSLVAGQKQPLRVDFSYQHGSPFLRVRPAIARLPWQGPGITARPVPETALFPPQGDGNGLTLEYRYTVAGKAQTVTQRKPEIDRTWFRNRAIAPKHVELQRPLLELLWSLASDPEYLAQAESGQRKHVLLSSVPFAEAMQLLPPRQAESARTLLDRKKLLRTATWDGVQQVYWSCRTAALQESFEVLMAWCQMHPESSPAFGTIRDFQIANRLPYQLLADAMASQYPPHRQLLEQAYLELPNGGCCLPVAYILSYALLEEGRISDWISRLKEALDDQSLAGDQRVDWLLAAAQAEEIRRALPQTRRRQLWLDHRLLAGLGWLETAILEARTEPVRLHAYQETIARLAARNDTRASARTQLEEAARACPASADTLALWRPRSTAPRLGRKRFRDRGNKSPATPISPS